MKTTIQELKDRCRLEYRNAVIRGEIKVQPCSVCGSTDRIEAHHADYTKPFAVVCYCKKHHNELHYGKTSKKKYVSDTEIVKLRIDSSIMEKIKCTAKNEYRKYTDQINYILKDWAGENN